MAVSNPLVSIIIPTYNRGHLIGQTLDSVVAQSYINWECIVVDDGSSDYTIELMEFYCERDSRIKFFDRPQERRKGANACRNFGFELSEGEYINWFDSDDLMMKENLIMKLAAFDIHTDFVISNTLNFDDSGNISRPYELNYHLEITPENFIGGNIGWITNDVLIRKEAVSLLFNEGLLSGQEYNFFSRLLYETTKGKYVKMDLAKRRIHQNSIQQTLKTKEIYLRNMEAFVNEWMLLQDIKYYATLNTKKRSINRLIRYSYYLSKKNKFTGFQKKTIKILVENKLYPQLFYYLLWTFTNLILGKGYFLLKRTN